MNEIKKPEAERDPKYNREVWYLAGPFYQYEENVKMLASKAGLRIIDATATDSREYAAPSSRLPKVTLKPQYDTEALAKAKTDADKAAAEEKAREKAEMEQRAKEKAEADAAKDKGSKSK